MDGVCEYHPKTCDDNNACTAESCVNGTCVNEWACPPPADPCLERICVNGACQTAPKDCDDGNPCTENSCEAAGCVHDNFCDDGNACTEDLCRGDGCAYRWSCDDGDKCTIDQCVEKHCTHTPKECPDDGNPCTDDRCDAATGNCYPPGPDGVACPDDSEVCTDDICDAGERTHPDTCEDLSNPTDWIDFPLTIDSCPLSCTPETSDLATDACGNAIKETCQPTPLYGGACAFEYWLNDTRVGLCVYTCGVNAVQVRFNRPDFCRVIGVRHRTRDRLDLSDCDEGTAGVYDWQVYEYDALGGPPHPRCRQGDRVDWGTEDNSTCENDWWQ